MAEQFGLPDQQLEGMIPVFIETLREHFVALEAAVAADNLEQTGRAAHTIKGALLNLGLGECAEMAADIERNAKAASMKTDYQELVGKIQAMLAGLFN